MVLDNLRATSNFSRAGPPIERAMLPPTFLRDVTNPAWGCDSQNNNLSVSIILQACPEQEGLCRAGRPANTTTTCVGSARPVCFR